MKGALFRVEKGKGHFYKWIRALVKVKWGLFLRIKGHFGDSWKSGGGGGVGTVPLAKRNAKPVGHSLIIFILVLLLLPVLCSQWLRSERNTYCSGDPMFKGGPPEQ